MSFFLRKRLALAVLGVISGPVSAAVFEVTTFADAVDASNNNNCLTSTGACSLRAAIQEANAQPSGPHTIKLPAGTYNLTLQGAQGQMEDGSMSGDLDINASMNIEGFGADKTTITVLNPSANTDYRVFHIGTSSAASVPNVTIKGVTIKGGQSTQGAGIYLQSGSLELIDSQIDANNVNISNSVGGAGIYSNGNLKIKNSTIANNVVSNNSNAFGGGIYIGQNSTGTQITGSTIYNNTTSGTQGGGIYNLSQNQSSPLVIASSTIYRNTVVQGGAGAGLFGVTGASMQMRNSVLAGSLAGGSSVIDCGGSITSGGYNFIGSAVGGTACTVPFATGDQIATSTLTLGSFGSNGGTTSTLSLIGSSLSDAGNPAGCTAADNTSLTTDQRGYLRSVQSSGTPGTAGRCDIGATELNSAFVATAGASSTGVSAGNQSISVYGPTGAYGSLLGVNPEVLRTTDTNAPIPVALCGQTATPTGLVYCLDTSGSTTTRGTASINQATGFFVYTGPTGGTGVDSFKYVVQNASGGRATGDVSITFLSSPVLQTTPLVTPAGGLALAVKPGSKIRATLPVVDTSASNSTFIASTVSTKLPQKGAVSFISSGGNLFMEYSPNDSSGVDSFDVVVNNSVSSAVIPVTVNISGGGTTPSTSSLVASGAFIKDEVSRTGQTFGDLKTALRYPNNAAISFPTSGIILSPNVGSLVVNADGNFTYTAPTSVISDGRVTFKVMPSYDACALQPLGTSCIPTRVNMSEMTVTLNFLATGLNANQATVNASRTQATTFNLSQYVTGLPSSVTNASYTQLSQPSNGILSSITAGTGAVTYTPTSAGTVSQDSFTYRVSYVDPTTQATIQSGIATITLSFVGVGIGGVPNPMAYTANAVSRTSTVPLPLQTALASVTSGLPQGATFEIAYNNTNWTSPTVSSVSSTNGTLTVTNSATGLLSYAAFSTVAPTVPPDSFQYRVRYTDPTTGASVTTNAAALNINFISIGNPEPLSPSSSIHVVPGQATTITLTYMTVAKSHIPVTGTLYLITSLPNRGRLVDDVSGADIALNSVLMTARVRYVPGTGSSGEDSFTFKVREPVLNTSTFIDSLASAKVTLDISNQGGSSTLDEGGGGSLNPLALLALFALYARRRLH